MGKAHPAITDDLQVFIRAQPLFFVATAPLDAASHINLSPKGLDCFRVVSPHQVTNMRSIDALPTPLAARLGQDPGENVR